MSSLSSILLCLNPHAGCQGSWCNLQEVKGFRFNRQITVKDMLESLEPLPTNFVVVNFSSQDPWVLRC